MKMNKLVGSIVLIALGAGLMLWLSSESSDSRSPLKLEIQKRDSIIDKLTESRSVLLLEIDSLRNAKRLIEYQYDTLEIHHQERNLLPFDLDDTAARYQFFARRFPNLFASSSN